MGDHDSPISIHGGGTLAKAIVQEQEHWSVPDGTILSSGSKRLAAFAIDVVIVSSILDLATRGMVVNALNISLWASSDSTMLLLSLLFFSLPTGCTGD